MEADDSITFYDLGLCQEMIDAAKAEGWTIPTAIQAKTIPSILSGKDVCGMAQTGSGKTGAFALPIYHQLLENQSPMFALILEPTRELVLQVADVFRSLGKPLNAKVCSITGGVEEKTQIQILERQPHIIVATTGRLNQIMREKPNINFKTIKILVFDEADQMLSPSFLDEVAKILKRIGPNHQSLLFSATMPEEIENLVKSTLTNPVNFELNLRNETASTLEEYVAVCPNNQKEVVLYLLIKDLQKKPCIVFTGSCKTAHILWKMLNILHISTALYHGKLQQKQRQAALQQFKQGKYSVLVATNVASRGLDIPQVDTVINYELPDKDEEYVHRVGRAGRAARCGFAITMITINDLPHFAMLEKFLKKKLQKKDIDPGEMEAYKYDVEQARKSAVIDFKEYQKKQTKKLKEKYR
ncbi:DEAD/DEAH box helicase family protein [Histomonas meleagridis]|uniref:DEAD/DEAH box helicase family protein n=1 Tax=Histomonas meleagridis TaxID=135588 RepID=UPI003559DE7E|nr:DEAD/DEAH box helicase family protein [Histomonas meleagridis]KAH0802932.1 DEAD/DEAH box helicase family protein [Histomonas meleagridis]